jgi:hypothetical protein
MAHINETFSDPWAGVLEVTLSGAFEAAQSRDAGFPGGADSNIMVRASVNGAKTPSIDRYTPSVKASFDYPGGNVNWTIATETLVYTFGSYIGAMAIKNLKLDLVLIKR